MFIEKNLILSHKPSSSDVYIFRIIEMDEEMRKY